MTSADIDNADSGTHLKIKFRSNSFLLHDEALLKRFLLKSVYRIGAEPLMDPVVKNVALTIKKLGRDPYADEGGISGFCGATLTGTIVLSVSHIACHTWPVHNGKKVLNEDGDAVLDVYSCRPFDKHLILDTLSELYKPSRIQCSDISHTLKWKADNAELYALNAEAIN